MASSGQQALPCLVLLAVLATLAARVTASSTVRYRVLEELPVGSVIGRLADDAAEALSRLPVSVSPRFRAVTRRGAAASSALLVRERDGEISVRARLDREALCFGGLMEANCTLEFDVLTLPTEHLQLFHVVVELVDVNDHAPRFARPMVPVEISESAAVGTRVPLDSATDPDAGDNGLQSYSLAPSKTFGIDVLTRPNGAKYAELVVLAPLDREERASYELELTATDGGDPPRTGTTMLRITIADSNDNSPAFEKSSYVVTLAEDAPLGMLIVDLNATDPDEGTNGKIVYSFGAHVSPKVLETFRIDPDDGRLTLLRKVDFEMADSYDIDVQAQDMGPNSMPAHCKVTVKVLDVNDNKPDVAVSLMAPGEEDVAFVSEAAALDTFVALVRVDDADSGLNGEVVCRLLGQGHFRLQKTHEKNYMILTNASLDREKRSEYSLTVIAEDRGAPSLSTVKHFTVQVQDENDNAPSFDKSRYEVFKAENNSPGAYLATLQASDPDLGANGQVSYSILESLVQGSSISTYVTVDPSTGALYALRTFDREELSQIYFLVQARDSGNPPLSSNVSVILNVLDENDNRPVILAPPLWNHSAEVPVSRRADAGELVTVIRATDRDAGANGDLSCHIIVGNEAGYFSMDSRTCEIYTNASMKDVPMDRVDITVLVQDHGSEPLGTKAVLRLTLYENLADHHQTPYQTGSGSGGENVPDASTIIIISLGAVCGLLLIIMVAFALRCSRDKKDTHSYNCRVAESTYQQHPRKPSRQIHKGEITLVPTVNGTLPIRAHHHGSSPGNSPGQQRAHMSSRQSHHSHQSLNSLVTISSNHIPESFALELTHATPPVEQVSQLLSLLHQGQYQPRPSFRGNKYTRSYRYALQDMDKFSLKDSGRGDSDAGDSDCETGRDSPIDRLLGDGFGELFHIDGQNRLHPVMKLCTDECRVLGHSDQCWMPSMSSTDYRTNMFIPGEESRPRLLDDDQRSVDSNRKSFSTFGKDSQEEEEEEDGGGGGSSLLSEMNTVFQRLLPPSYAELGDDSAPSAVAAETRKCFLPGKAGPAAASPAYQQGVAAWAANTHFQNPSGVAVATGHGPTNHASAQTHLKWLPAMEEIPENYEEDEMDKRNEAVGELAAEISKLLQDVRDI
ncbi:protocadherin-18a isoform X2 [Colossoma macropomum]|uniref:protocadherin-18a isoform X2 n=1 Tax=Colossoma macropomum TaxID=42526 RepID=UPI001863CA1B|nr:protocadherin-18a isoform X2 [Colossoma macropomum]